MLIEGEVAENTVRYGGGFDTGVVTVKSGARRVALGVYNEFMTADEAGARVSTFPDFLGSLDPASGDPVAISALNAGARVAMVIGPAHAHPARRGRVRPRGVRRGRSGDGLRAFPLRFHLSKGASPCDS